MPARSWRGKLSGNVPENRAAVRWPSAKRRSYDPAALDPRPGEAVTIIRSLLALAILACLSPIAGLAYVGCMANRYGCTVHEGFPNPCVVDGVDIGQRLYTLGVMGWVLLATIPIAGLIALAWIAIEVVRWLARRRRAAGPAA
jgi:hypothetical protein